MKGECGLIQERFVDYWEGTAEEADRQQVEKHLAGCTACAEEFRLWEESSRLIRELQLNEEWPEDDAVVDELNRSVMNRIYADQRWSRPLSRRSYVFSGAFRMRVSGLLAAIMAIFLCGLFYTVSDRLHAPHAQASGIMETADAFRTGTHASSSGMLVEVPVASLSDPIVLRANATMPEYWVVLSLLGALMTLLIMNWFSRVRA